MHAVIQATLKELSQALQDLHKDLLMREARALIATDDKPLNPYDLLAASLHDPRFAWLRQFSAMIVHIDTIVDEISPLSAQDSHKIASEVLNLVEKPEEGKDQEFWIKYTSYLNDPHVIMKHSRVKEIILKLRPSL
ncbi:MAG: hypothetical protein AB7F86_08300 [Bdellovibrionales bacterium]